MQQQLRIDLHDLGYRPLVSASAPEARELLERERMAAVLLDLVLDEGEDSGFELLEWIRHHHPGLPVIVLSAAQVNSAAIRRAYELGASSYFVKGNVPMAHIYSDLAARLVERGTGRPGSYRFGRLEFDPTRRTVTIGGDSVHLTQQQAALVLFLAQGSKPATACRTCRCDIAAKLALTGRKGHCSACSIRPGSRSCPCVPQSRQRPRPICTMPCSRGATSLVLSSWRLRRKRPASDSRQFSAGRTASCWYARMAMSVSPAASTHGLGSLMRIAACG